LRVRDRRLHRAGRRRSQPYRRRPGGIARYFPRRHYGDLDDHFLAIVVADAKTFTGSSPPACAFIIDPRHHQT
jgi:hypothetical protein